jgi:hypothetical protein
VVPDRDPNASHLGFSRSDQAFLLLVGVVGGLALGWALPHVADWLVGLSWAPFQGPAELVASWDGTWALLTYAGVGLVGGTALAAYAVWETPSYVVDDSQVTMTAQGKSTTTPRADVSAVFVEDKRLVLLDRLTREIGRHPFEAKVGEVERAFREHGYPWCASDPHRDEWRRYVRDDPAFDAAEHAVLAARERALDRDDAPDAQTLRGELAGMGLVVKDDGKRRHVRRIASSGAS